MRFSTASMIARAGIALTLAAVNSLAAETPAPGQALFRQRCGMCHQQGGFGTNTLASRLGFELSLLEQRTDLDPKLVRQVARRGIGSMPAFTKVELTDEELAKIADYLGR